MSSTIFIIYTYLFTALKMSDIWNITTNKAIKQNAAYAKMTSVGKTDQLKDCGRIWKANIRTNTKKMQEKAQSRSKNRDSGIIPVPIMKPGNPDPDPGHT